MRDNVKILRTQSLLQEAIGEALSELEDTRLKNIAVTRTECSKGKEVAKVFLDKNSLGDLSENDALKLLKNASGAIRANIGAQLSWYRTPNLVFVIDESLANINRLDAIFRQIHKRNSSLEKYSVVDSANLESKTDSSLRGSGEATTKQSKNFPSLATDTLPQPPLARGGASFDSPSLAEGIRGWVKSPKESSK